MVNRGKGALEVDLGIHETVSAFGSEQALSVKDCLVFLELASHSTGSPSHSEGIKQQACRGFKICTGPVGKGFVKSTNP